MAQKSRKKTAATNRFGQNRNFAVDLVIIVIFTSVVFFPFIFDSFTISKLLVASFGLLLFTLSLIRLKSTSQINTPPAWLLTLSALFMLSLLISWAISGVPFIRGAFGQFGRGNGFLYYFLSIMLFIFAAQTFNDGENTRVHKLISFFSWFLVTYAFLQKIGIDIAELDTRGISSVVLTYGNSNFAGGMLSALFAYHLIYIIVSENFSTRGIMLLISLLISATFPAAVQGYLIIVFSIFLGISIYLPKRYKSPWVSRVLLTSWLLGILSIILGLMGKFIFARVFERESFQARIEYWRISLSIIKDHIFFGVGPDRLFDITPLYMAPNSLNIITTTRMDNAHNWYLNLAANFGIISLTLLLLIFAAVLGAGLRLIRSFTPKNSFQVASFAGFLAVFIDGCVSIEQPGIGIWLYYFAGVTISNWINSKSEFTSSQSSDSGKPRHLKLSLLRAFTAPLITVLLFSTILTSMRVIQDALLRKNIQTQLLGKGDIATLEKIGLGAIMLKAEPEYSVQALGPLAAAGAKGQIDEVSKAAYEYYKGSIQATLIRADVLRVLDRNNEACPLRITLVNNTPWDMNQLYEYLMCKVNGLDDPNSLQTLRKVSIYLPADSKKEIPIAVDSLDELNSRIGKYAVAAQFNHLLGNSTKANEEKEYALSLVYKVQKLEESMGIIATQPDRNNYLQLLNF